MLVKNIKFSNNKVRVILDEGDFCISKENYIENPLAVNSEISAKKINFLLENEKVVESKMFIIKVLNRKVLSEYEVYTELQKRQISDKHIKSIISNLKNVGLINDEYTSVITVESELIKRKGKKQIKKVLREKKISEEIIESAIKTIDEGIYLDNFKKVVNKYLSLYDKKSLKMKECLVKRKLEEAGYEKELIETTFFVEDENKELDLARMFLNKIIKNKNMDFGKKENINKIKAKLAMKGFNYDIINSVVGEVVNDETY